MVNQTVFKPVHFIYLLFLLILTSCTSTGPRTLHLQSETEHYRLWPATPEQPRYRYLGQLTGEKNFIEKNSQGGNVASFFKWLVGLDGQSQHLDELKRPQGGMVDEKGRIYVTDISRGAVFVFDEVAGQLLLWQWAEPDVAFKAPIGIAKTNQGEILVADAELAQVYRLDASGKPIGAFGKGLLKRPTGLAYDSVSQQIFVADGQAHNIKVFNHEGKLLKTIGRRGRGKGEFNGPTYLNFSRGRLYVSDTLNARIQVFDKTGKYQLSIGKRGLYVGNLTRPKGVTVDQQGNVYVIESYHDHLLVYDKSGRYLLPIGGTGKGVGQFFLPAGIWTDKNNRIFIADMFNGRVVVLQYLEAPL